MALEQGVRTKPLANCHHASEISTITVIHTIHAMRTCETALQQTFE
eukprot:UN10621